MSTNPFLSSFASADPFGKLIFFALFALSIVSWIVLIHKFLILKKVRIASEEFSQFVKHHNESLFHLTPRHIPKMHDGVPHPFAQIYLSLKKKLEDFLAKNQYFTAKTPDCPVYLSQADVQAVKADIEDTICREVQKLESNLFILTTTASLAPFLGLLGTVWGILVAFNELQSGASLGSSMALMGGLSTALTTTVLGLLIAIPALVGFNYFKNAIRNMHTDIDAFSSHLMAQVDLQYRQVDV